MKMTDASRSPIICREDIEFILKPVFESTRKVLQLSVSEDLNCLAPEYELDMIEKYEKEATRIYKVTPELIGVQSLTKNYMTQNNIEEEDERVTTLKDKIDLFAGKNLLLKIDAGEEQLKLLPDPKLLITPLGIHFLNYCQLRLPSSDGILDFDEAFSFAARSLGSAYNNHATSRISEYLDQIKSSLNKREIAMTTFLLFSDATAADKAIRVEKSAYSDFLVPIRFVSKEIFLEPELFPNNTEADNAIRRSTGAGGLEGKTLWYVKEDTHDRSGYLLYFRFNEDQVGDALEFVVRRLLDSLKKLQEKENSAYQQKVLELLNKHINDHNFIFESKSYIREKILLAPGIKTAYLRRLFEVMKKYMS